MNLLEDDFRKTKNLKIAVIYTGEVRTIEKTISFFKKNILLNDNVHIFATLQSNNIPYYTDFVKLHFGKHLKSLEWFNPLDEFWVKTRETLLSKMDIRENLKHYLRTSGSMIEYYQLYLTYQNLIKFEHSNQKYDYIIRIRPDIVITKPITFEWLNLSIEDDFRNTKISQNESKQIKTIKTNKTLSSFMNTLLDNRNNFIDNTCIPLENNLDLKECYYIQNYIKNGKYILTLRKNLLYIVKREYFSNIPLLGINYGLLKMKNNDYWWNAESQFQATCLENNLTIFDSCTKLEDQSLYEYKEENYFKDLEKRNNEENYCENHLLKDIDALFFIRRY